jgi:hypothetical protein
MFDNPTIVPAYGRDYRSEKEARADWYGGKDFQVAITGQYCSIRDFDKTNKLQLRFWRNRKSIMVQGE